MHCGVVIRATNGYYYVKTDTAEVMRCKLRGKMKKDKVSICVGDKVQYIHLDNSDGIIENVLSRRTLLKRPQVANVDQVIITFAAKSPDINYLLVDRFLVLAEHSELDIVICINKCDLADKEDLNRFVSHYKTIGYKVLLVSAKKEIGVEKLKNYLKDKVSVFAGPSGVGKSTLLNTIESKFDLNTGVISDKIKRGKHTTRVAELMPLSIGGFVVDTPGFSFTEFNDIDKKDLRTYFPEFFMEKQCKYNSCLHENEPQCAIKQGVSDGIITEERYTSYLNILNEIKNIKKEF